MYNRHEASQLRQAFWTAFGLYMLPVLSAEGEKIAWVNYKTGEKFCHFKMEACNRSAFIAIELRHPDTEMRNLFFNQLYQLKEIFETHTGERWQWQQQAKDEYGKVYSRVYYELLSVSVFNKADWPALVSFFKRRIIALDAFWSEARYYFEVLR